MGGPSPSNDDPMQVDALHKGGGKGKQKGKVKGKEKGKKGGKKGKVKGKKGKVQYFEGTCNYCEKYCHKEADCWKKKNKVDAASTETPVIEQVGAICEAKCKRCGQEVHEDFAVVHGEPFHPGCVARVEIYDVSDPEDPRIDEYDQNWVMAVQSSEMLHVKAAGYKELEDDEVWVLWDSGSDEHLCKQNIADKGTKTPC